MIYLSSFFISGLIVALIIFFRNRQYIPLVFILFIIAIFASSILAGVRSFNVGTDTGAYDVFFQKAVNAPNFITAYNGLFKISDLEPLFIVLTYIVSRVSINYHVYQFVCAAIINGNIIMAIYLVRKKYNMVLCWLTYCLLIYTNSLNIVRQTLALSIDTLAIALLINKHNKTAFCTVCVACFVHKTAIIGLLIFLVSITFNHVHNRRSLLLLTFPFLIVTLFMPLFLSILGNNGLVPGKYSSYLISSGNTSIVWGLLIRLPMILVLFFTFINDHSLIDQHTNFVYFFLIQEILLLPLQIITPVAGRLALYFSITKIFAYPGIVKSSINQHPKLKWLIIVVYVLFITLVFIMQVLVNKEGQIYPFH